MALNLVSRSMRQCSSKQYITDQWLATADLSLVYGVGYELVIPLENTIVFSR